MVIDSLCIIRSLDPSIEFCMTVSVWLLEEILNLNYIGFLSLPFLSLKGTLDNDS